MPYTRFDFSPAVNQVHNFILAIVLIDGERAEGPLYVPHPFTKEPDRAVTRINLGLEALLARVTASG